MQASTILTIRNLLHQGPLSYADGLSLQTSLHAQRVAGQIDDTLLFLEHQPVITMGRRAVQADILASPELLAEKSVVIHHSDRGGQVTFHGPGQLVIYFIIHLGSKVRQVRGFVEGIERSIIEYLQQRYGLAAHLESEHPGIWLPSGKVAAVGISLKERVSMHGVALNLAVKPDYFKLIVPCGIYDRPAVSVADFSPRVDSLAEAADALGPIIAKSLGYLEWRF